MRQRRRRRKQSGFTLLEVLVALAVLGIGVALTMSAISGSLGNIRKVTVRTRTIQQAESVMELALLDESIEGPTVLQGDFEDGSRWTVQVEEFLLPESEGMELQPQQLPLALLSFSVAIMRAESSTPDFRLHTLKLINTQQQTGTASRSVR